MKPDSAHASRFVQAVSRRALLAPVLSACLFPAGQVLADETWRLANGAVTVPERWSCGGMELAAPELVGSGSSGAVFSSLSGTSRVAVKISWATRGAVTSVENERRIIAHLNMAGATGVEKLVAACKLDGQRTVLVLAPLVEDPVESIDDLSSPTAQARAADGLAMSLVQMLAARVATTDVQLLADASGEPLLVDFTEAKIMPTGEADMALVNSFVAEIDALFPATGVVRERFIVAVSAALRTVQLEPDLEDALRVGLGL
jgi:hypothetical protein